MTVGFIRIHSCMIFVVDVAVLGLNMMMAHDVIDMAHGVIDMINGQFVADA